MKTTRKSQGDPGATSTRKTAAHSAIGDSDLVDAQGDRLRLEAVEWYDHWSPGNNSWMSNDEVPDQGGLLVHTVGWVLRESDDGIYLVPTITEADSHRPGMFILKSSIRKRDRL